MADAAYRIGPALPTDSYLSIGAILDAARRGKATAIHPGYGFLSERGHFARAVEESGFTFIGPHADAIEMMGDKAVARQAAERVGVPIVPGTLEPVNVKEAPAHAERIGYPVVVKAAFGGGGRGMHVVRSTGELEPALKRGAREAEAYFGRPEVFLERYVDRAHHVEAQILADHHGNAFFLGERDCSVQRRHQKLMEESPSPVVDADLRTRIGEAALALSKEAAYTNAGTVEFIVDEDGSFYFLEMNTRLQVEHTVTEMTTGLDLVAHQIDVTREVCERLAQAVPRDAATERVELGYEPVHLLPGGIEVDAQPLGAPAHVLSDRGRVLADAGSEHQRVDAAKRRGERAECSSGEASKDTGADRSQQQMVRCSTHRGRSLRTYARVSVSGCVNAVTSRPSMPTGSW